MAVGLLLVSLILVGMMVTANCYFELIPHNRNRRRNALDRAPDWRWSSIREVVEEGEEAEEAEEKKQEEEEREAMELKYQGEQEEEMGKEDE